MFSKAASWLVTDYQCGVWAVGDPPASSMVAHFWVNVLNKMLEIEIYVSTNTVNAPVS